MIKMPLFSYKAWAVLIKIYETWSIIQEIHATKPHVVNFLHSKHSSDGQTEHLKLAKKKVNRVGELKCRDVKTPFTHFQGGEGDNMVRQRNFTRTKTS